MATDTQTQAQPALAPDPLIEHRHLFSVEEYQRIVEFGAFGPESRVELIDGIIIDKMTQNVPHVMAVDRVMYLFIRLVPAGYFFSMGTPVVIRALNSMPEPDAQIFRGRLDNYADKPREPSDAALVVEVADTSYAFDRSRKYALYAKAGVPVYWLVDLNRRRLEVFSNPTGQGDKARYDRAESFGENDQAPFVLDGQELARFPVSQVLP